jgi:hypothetical protein
MERSEILAAMYAEEGLSIRTKPPRRKRAWRYRQSRPGAVAPKEVWAMDFMSDQPFVLGRQPIPAILCDQQQQGALRVARSAVCRKVPSARPRSAW